MALLDSLREEFSEENLPVYLLLGLYASLQRLEHLLPEEGQSLPGGPEMPATAPLPGLSRGAERLMYLALGLVSFRRNLMAALEPIRAAACTETGSGPPSSTGAQRGSAPLPDLRELLR